MPRATLFGLPAPQILNRKRKAKLIDLARRAIHANVLPQGVDRLTGTHVLVYEALLWRFHRNTRAVCFPALDTIARWIGCSVSAVQEALSRLEALGLITWTHRIKRVLAPSLDPASSSPTRTRVVRTSNAYRFTMPKAFIRRTFAPKPSNGGKDQGPRNPLIETIPVAPKQKRNDFLPITNWLNERIATALSLRREKPS